MIAQFRVASGFSGVQDNLAQDGHGELRFWTEFMQSSHGAISHVPILVTQQGNQIIDGVIALSGRWNTWKILQRRIVAVAHLMENLCVQYVYDGAVFGIVDLVS